MRRVLAPGAPLDVFIVGKLGYPGREKYAVGAIASGGVRVMNEDLASIAAQADIGGSAGNLSDRHLTHTRFPSTLARTP